jgi:hypothetical protein
MARAMMARLRVEYILLENREVVNKYVDWENLTKISLYYLYY